MEEKEIKEDVATSRELRKKQDKEHDKILRNVFLVIGFLVAGFLLLIFIINSSRGFEYRGVDFDIEKFCDSGPPCLVTYKTSLPVSLSDDGMTVTTEATKTNDYNFYLRNDPRELDVDFSGDIIFKKTMVLNSEDEFICDGKGSIAAANLNVLYRVLGTNVITDSNATCDPLGRYTLVNVVPGNETKIEHFWPACYTITIKDCEILEGTEKFMIETLVKVNEAVKNYGENQDQNSS